MNTLWKALVAICLLAIVGFLANDEMQERAAKKQAQIDRGQALIAETLDRMGRR